MRRVLPFAVLAGCHLALGLEEAEETVAPTPECSGAAECDDGDPCTTDSCDEARCVHAPLDMNAPDEQQTPGDCRRAICRDGKLTQVNDDADLPDDGIACTDDLCMLGAEAHPPLPGGTPCDDGGSVCNGAGACSECFTNQQCTAPDTCGGGGEDFSCGCTPGSCADAGKTCGSASDGCGMSLDCNNAAPDGDETDIDCGGNVNACATRCPSGAMCDVPGDCASMNCSGGTCQ